MNEALKGKTTVADEMEVRVHQDNRLFNDWRFTALLEGHGLRLSPDFP